MALTGSERQMRLACVSGHATWAEPRVRACQGRGAHPLCAEARLRQMRRRRSHQAAGDLGMHQASLAHDGGAQGRGKTRGSGTARTRRRPA
jgi:hypothetical protein